jgi:hypothetical protein
MKRIATYGSVIIGKTLVSVFEIVGVTGLQSGKSALGCIICLLEPSVDVLSHLAI